MCLHAITELSVPTLELPVPTLELSVPTFYLQTINVQAHGSRAVSLQDPASLEIHTYDVHSFMDMML